MTHFEATDRSRRILDHRPDCHHDLIDLGPDPDEPTLRTWACYACQVALLIDPTGVIRDTASPAFVAGWRENSPPAT